MPTTPWGGPSCRPLALGSPGPPRRMQGAGSARHTIPTNCSRPSSTGGHVLGKKQRDLKSEGLGKTEVPSLSGNSPQVDEGSRWVVLPPLAHGSHRQFLPTGRREAGHTLSFSVRDLRSDALFQLAACVPGTLGKVVGSAARCPGAPFTVGKGRADAEGRRPTLRDTALVRAAPPLTGKASFLLCPILASEGTRDIKPWDSLHPDKWGGGCRRQTLLPVA